MKKDGQHNTNILKGGIYRALDVNPKRQSKHKYENTDGTLHWSPTIFDLMASLYPYVDIYGAS